MAYKKLEKGSEEWQFFKDYYEFRQKYYEADNSEEWFEKLMQQISFMRNTKMCHLQNMQSN